ncbi:hypothetical protein [Tateyamaria sp.]|uniref:hypothetical protein n=1 Tax=Tateyamaria sp. TaxID=1929288 RepID=UPI0032DD3C12
MARYPHVAPRPAQSPALWGGQAMARRPDAASIPCPVFGSEWLFASRKSVIGASGSE